MTTSNYSRVTGLTEFTEEELAQLIIDTEKPYSQQTERTIHILLKGKRMACEWSTKDFENFFGVRYLSHLRFSDLATLKDAIQNSPWILRKSRWGEENRQMAVKYQLELQKGYVADITIGWIDDDLGFGVFAQKDIPSGAYIGEYTGLVRRFSRWRPDSNAYCFQYSTKFWTWKNFVIDAFKEGNELRFINHSEDPNLKPACIVDRGLLHFVFFSSELIPAGTELTFNYGPDFWRHRRM